MSMGFGAVLTTEEEEKNNYYDDLFTEIENVVHDIKGLKEQEEYANVHRKLLMIRPLIDEFDHYTKKLS